MSHPHKEKYPMYTSLSCMKKPRSLGDRDHFHEKYKVIYQKKKKSKNMKPGQKRD